jgi:hypothetical protein
MIGINQTCLCPHMNPPWLFQRPKTPLSSSGCIATQYITEEIPK